MTTRTEDDKFRTPAHEGSRWAVYNKKIDMSRVVNEVTAFHAAQSCGWSLSECEVTFIRKLCEEELESLRQQKNIRDSRMKSEENSDHSHGSSAGTTNQGSQSSDTVQPVQRVALESLKELSSSELETAALTCFALLGQRAAWERLSLLRSKLERHNWLEIKRDLARSASLLGLVSKWSEQLMKPSESSKKPEEEVKNA